MKLNSAQLENYQRRHLDYVEQEGKPLKKFAHARAVFLCEKLTRLNKRMYYGKIPNLPNPYRTCKRWEYANLNTDYWQNWFKELFAKKLVKLFTDETSSKPYVTYFPDGTFLLFKCPRGNNTRLRTLLYRLVDLLKETYDHI